MKNLFLKLNFLLILLFITGCATPLVKLPNAKSVKKIGIISLYMQEELADKSGISGLVESVKKIKGENPNEYAAKQIIESAFRSYQTNLNSLNRWEVVDTKNLINNREYKLFFGQIERDDVDNPDLSKKTNKLLNSKVSKKIMQFASGLGDKSNKSNVFVPFENMAAYDHDFKKANSNKKYLQLGDLAKKFDLDAVAIIKVDISARRTGGASIFKGGVFKAKPVIRNSLLVVNQDGIPVIDSSREPFDETRAEKQVRFYAKNSKKQFKGYVFYDKDNENKTYINAAIADAAANMRSQIEMGFIK